MFQKKLEKKIIIYTDGGSRGNPGPAAVGIVFDAKKYSEYIGKATNNEAEYRAVIFALKKIKAIFGKKAIKNLHLEIRLDSEFLIRQLNGQYKVLDSKIQPLFLQVWNLKIDFGKVRFELVSREENQEADRLVNEILDSEHSYSTFPKQDLTSYFNLL